VLRHCTSVACCSARLYRIRSVCTGKRSGLILSSQDLACLQAKVIDLTQQRVSRTLRGVHRSMLGCTLMRNGTQRADVLTGGMDSVVCRWDGTVGKPLHAFNLQDDVSDAGSRLVNPPMAYALAQPSSESPAPGSTCVPRAC
jgi:hypothetical protein